MDLLEVDLQPRRRRREEQQLNRRRRPCRFREEVEEQVDKLLILELYKL